MLHLALSVCLFLVAGINAENFDNVIEHVVKHKRHMPLMKNHLFAPDVAKDRENFVALEYEQITNQSVPELRVVLHLYTDWLTDFQDGQNYKNLYQEPIECTLNLKGREGAVNIGVSSLRRFKRYGKVTFMWYDEMTDSTDRITRLVAIDIKNDCRQMKLAHEHLPGSPILIPIPKTTSYYLFVEGEDICGKKIGKRCVIQSELKSKDVTEIHSFNVTLDWSSLHIERSSNDDFIVRGFEGTTYKVMRINHKTNKIDMLMSRLDVQSDLQFVSSNLSFCWNANPTTDEFINCAQYNANNQVEFIRKVDYDGIVKLIDVHPTGPGQFIVTVKPKYSKCNNIDNCEEAALISTRIQNQKFNNPYGIKAQSRNNIRACGKNDEKDITFLDISYYSHALTQLYYICKVNEYFRFGMVWMGRQMNV